MFFPGKKQNVQGSSLIFISQFLSGLVLDRAGFKVCFRLEHLRNTPGIVWISDDFGTFEAYLRLESVLKGTVGLQFTSLGSMISLGVDDFEGVPQIIYSSERQNGCLEYPVMLEHPVVHEVDFGTTSGTQCTMYQHTSYNNIQHIYSLNLNGWRVTFQLFRVDWGAFLLPVSTSTLNGHKSAMQK